MKKLLAGVLVAVMVFSALAGLAEADARKNTAEDLKKYAGDMLKSLQNYYNKNPEKCGDEFIMITYSYYDMYRVMEEVIDAEEQYSLGKSSTIGQAKEHAQNNLLVNVYLLQQWYNWLNGDMENSEFLEWLMSLVGATIKAMDTDK